MRADSTARTGTGHIMRCLALAQSWHDRGGRAALLSCCESDTLRTRVESSGVEVLPLDAAYPDPGDLRATLARLDVLAAEHASRPWLVADGYQFDPGYYDAVTAAGHRLLVIDDMAHLPTYNADVVLNPNADARDLDYACDPRVVLLLGSRYVLLRREFLGWTGWRRRIAGEARRVLVTLGGSDPDNMTAVALGALGRVRVADLEAVVVVGGSNPHQDALRTAASRCPASVRVVRDADDMPGLMAWADVAVSAGGTTCFELAFMGLPSLLVALAENQRANVEALSKAGAAASLGPASGLAADTVAAALTELCRDAGRRVDLSRRGRELVDAEGARRTLDVAWGLAAARLGDGYFTVRPAAPDDALPIWGIANDPAVRANSFHQAQIPLGDHTAWYGAKLASADCRIWVADVGGAVAAMVRYERSGPATVEVHFAAAAPFRGKGLGTRMLELTAPLACRELDAQQVRGTVFADNTASARAFEKAGFAQGARREVSGRACRTYEWGCS